MEKIIMGTDNRIMDCDAGVKVEQPAVSVIIPVYNVEKYVRECLTSVMNQTLTDIEIICIDNCSDDNSMKIVEELAGQDNRIKTMYNKANVGVSASRNRAMDAATGEYIYFLDADDMITPEALETLYDYSSDRHLDILYFDTKQILETANPTPDCLDYKESHVTYTTEPEEGGELLKRFINAGDWEVTVWRQFFKREFIVNSKVRFRENIYYTEDNVFSFEIILAAHRVCCIPYIPHIYRRRPESQTTSKGRTQKMLVLAGYRYNLYRRYMTEYKGKELYDCIALMAKAVAKNIWLQYRHIDSFDSESLSEYKDELETIYAITMTLYGGYFPYKLSEKLMNDIRLAKHAVIYGAGKVGAGLLELLEDCGVKIDCFAVTSGGGSIYHGYDVRDIGSLECEKKDTIILIAVIKNIEAMRTAAYENGFYNVVSFEWKKGIPTEIR